MHLEREDGTMVTVTDIEGDSVVVDGNHPGRQVIDLRLYRSGGAPGNA